MTDSCDGKQGVATSKYDGKTSVHPVQLALGCCLTLVLWSLWPHMIALHIMPSCHCAMAVAASPDSAVVVTAYNDSSVVAAVESAPATRATADRLWPSTIIGWISVDHIKLVKFLIYVLLTLNSIINITILVTFSSQRMHHIGRTFGR